uniref:Uncharacterized protein n=1 Tax=Parascaris univalens TaxID=6257 RepID=A0A915CK48_PARUN
MAGSLCRANYVMESREDATEEKQEGGAQFNVCVRRGVGVCSGVDCLREGLFVLGGHYVVEKADRATLMRGKGPKVAKIRHLICIARSSFLDPCTAYALAKRTFMKIA